MYNKMFEFEITLPPIRPIPEQDTSIVYLHV